MQILLVRYPHFRMGVHRALVHRFEYDRIRAVLQFYGQPHIVLDHDLQNIGRRCDRWPIGHSDDDVGCFGRRRRSCAGQA